MALYLQKLSLAINQAMVLLFGAQQAFVRIAKTGVSGL